MTEYQEELRHCARCYSERTCRLYKDDIWLCTTGPDKCWRKRKVFAVKQ